jgi:hypothetical protein
MKKAIIIIGIISLLFSCKKSSTSTDNIPANLVTSVTRTNPTDHYVEKDTLLYDVNQNLVQLSYIEYDSAPGSVYLDTGSYYFTINPATNLPTSYTYNYFEGGYADSAFTETDNLFFDNQGRLIDDTLLSEGTAAFDSTATYYTYSANTIVVTQYGVGVYSPNQASDWGYDYTDSLLLDNGNLVHQASYTLSNGTWYPDDLTNVNSYSTYPNPLYNQRLSLSLGAFFLDQYEFDCLSKDLPADGIVKWITDANGRVVSAIGTDGSTTTYTYK